MEKINVAELLKDCVSGMELDCTICDNIYFDKVTPNMIKCFIKNGTYNTIYFHHDGTYLTTQNAKCVIFPKGKTTWEGFQRPFKDGDIVTWEDRGSLVACIYKERKNTTSFNHHIALYEGGLGIVVNGEIVLTDDELCLATEEEKQKLFQAIKENGYKWNPKTNNLEKLIEPKFKVGDRIKKGEKIATIVSIYKNLYDVKYDSGIGSFTINLQDDWELVPNKFDITTLKPFDKVLVRQNNHDTWHIGFFEKYNNRLGRHPFICMYNSIYAQCVPYEENKHLLDTFNNCDDFYKTWE